MYKYLLAALFTIVSLASAQAQNSPDYFKTLPVVDANTPAWAVLMYSTNPKVGEVVDAYYDYYKQHEFVKTTHTQNFKFWIRRVEPLLNANGFIAAPDKATEDVLMNQLIQKRQQTIGSQRTPGASTEWVSIGPFETYRQNTTDHVSLQSNVYSLDQSTSNPNLLICGTESGGVYKSVDKGLNWQLVTKGEVFAGSNTAVKIHPSNPDIFFVAANNRIYRSINGGTTWAEVYYTAGTGNEFKFHPTNTDTIFHTSSTGLYRTNDGGDNWTRVFTVSCWDIDFQPNNPSTIYLVKTNAAAKRAELFRSDDTGDTWTLKANGWYVPTDINNASDGGAKIGVTPASPNMVYVCLIGASKTDDDGWIGVYRSTNNGDTWNNPSGQNGGPYNTINGLQPWNVAAYSDGYHQGYYNFDLEVSAIDPNKIWIGTIRLSESADGGATFTAIGAANSNRLDGQHADIQDIEVNGNDVWVASDGGINYSNDELNTQDTRNTGIMAADFWGFNTGWNDDTYAGGKYHNGNTGWYEGYGTGKTHNVGGVEESTGYVHPIESRKLLFGYSNYTDVRTIPLMLGGTTVNGASLAAKPNESYSVGRSSGISFDPRYANHLYLGSDNKVMKSTNGGGSFNTLFTFPDVDGMVYEIEISRSNPNVMYAVYNPLGGYWDYCEIWKTTNGGLNWTQTTNITGNRRALFITINPEDENEVWLCSADGANGSKVFRTTNGGASWSNMSSSTLNGESMRDILYQGGTNDVVYVATNYSIFYWDAGTSAWVDYSLGLPLIAKALRLNPFYRDSELRFGTYGRGVWARAMVDTMSLPIAQPITYSDSVFCSRDTVQFDCFSMLNHDAATWAWTFSPAPMYVSSTSTRNPQVVFGADGGYDVTLTITDRNGNSSSKTILGMVKVKSSCDADTIPGMALNTIDNNDYFVADNANLTNITHFSTTAWIKPDGQQDGFAGIVSNGEWCAHCTTNTIGLIIDYFGEKLYYRWPDGGGWGSNSGMTVPLDEWSYVAMVVTPDSVILYLNEDKWVQQVSLSPVTIANLYVGHGHYDKSFHGLIDEVTIWNRALSQDEVRAMRHLTKENMATNDPSLIAYYQFNGMAGDYIMDAAGGYHGVLNDGATLSLSTAPIGGGTSQRLNISNGGNIDFPIAGAKLYFTDCNQPQGEVVVTRINQTPYLPANANGNPGKYWVINHYDGPDFATLDTIQLNTANSAFVNGLNNASNAYLHLRGQHADDLSWTTNATGKWKAGSTLGFAKSNRIDGAYQVYITNGGTAFTETELRTINASTCDTFVSPTGKLLTSTGVYLDTLPQGAGASCDSVVSINLLVNITNTILTERACQTYTSPKGNTYTSSGIYYDTLQGTASCDSVLTIDLTIINSITASTTTSGATITATNTGATYQWLNCDNGQTSIAGATNASYTATANGSYAVVVNDHGCIDTSACVPIVISSVAGIDNQAYFQVYPNPNGGRFTIDLALTQPNDVLVEVYNTIGVVVYQQNLNQVLNSSVLIDLTALPAAAYYVKLSSNEFTAVQKVLKMEW